MESIRFKLKGHEQEVSDAYLSGVSTPDIGKLFGVSAASVAQCLDKQGILRRPPGTISVRTHCKNGHPWVEENIYTQPKGGKVCRICRQERAYASRKKNPEVNREYQRLWAAKQRAENADRLKGYNLRKDYGIGLEVYKTKLINQQGRCKICNEIMERPCIDHDHETDTVRDLLCNSCNSGLGFFKDNPTVVQSAADYLKKWKTNAASQ